jgi:type IV pilus assembly protein PilV
MSTKSPVFQATHKTRRLQRGVGVVEVLIALVVISFGVLGMAGLQLTGMKQSNNGYNRSKAVMLAEDMTTRMRINASGSEQALYNKFDSTTTDCTARPEPYCQAYRGFDGAACDAQNLAIFDMYVVACGEWGLAGSSGGVADLLPANSALKVVCDVEPCVPGASYTVSVTWPEGKNASSADASHTGRVQMRLQP